MTELVKGLTVTLTRDTRFDDVEVIISAIQMIKGVADVTPSLTDVNDQINRNHIKQELREKFQYFMEENLMEKNLYD